MKPITLSKQFNKAYAKRIGGQQKLRGKYMERVAIFRTGERGYPLDDHALTGKLTGKRAFSVTADIRVIYQETPSATIFLDIGTHNRVYR